MINTNCRQIVGLVFLIFFIFCFTTFNVLAGTGKIRCKAPNQEDQRVWKYSDNQGSFEIWTLYSGNFYPFCTHGYSLHFPNGFLCAYDAKREIGTVATFIDFQDARVTDILIWEDTLLNDPRSWKQKSETQCEMIRN